MTLVLDVPTETTAPAFVDYRSLIDQLETWRAHDAQVDRRLSDLVLLASGWTISTNEAVRGGYMWTKGGDRAEMRAPAARPHPVMDFVAARAILPRPVDYSLVYAGGNATVTVLVPGSGHRFVGTSPAETVALLIAALKYREFEQSVAMLFRAAGAA